MRQRMCGSTHKQGSALGPEKGFNGNYLAPRNVFIAAVVTDAIWQLRWIGIQVPESLMTVLSAIVGAVLVAIGSNFIVPIGSVVGGVCDLAGIASLMVFLGLLDGE
jgi:hypothetical protein